MMFKLNSWFCVFFLLLAQPGFSRAAQFISSRDAGSQLPFSTEQSSCRIRVGEKIVSTAWAHDSSGPYTFRLTFKGNYVHATCTSDVQFAIDGVPPETNVSIDPHDLYVRTYRNDSLSEGEHVLSIYSHVPMTVTTILDQHATNRRMTMIHARSNPLSQPKVLGPILAAIFALVSLVSGVLIYFMLNQRRRSRRKDGLEFGIKHTQHPVRSHFLHRKKGKTSDEKRRRSSSTQSSRSIVAMYRSSRSSRNAWKARLTPSAPTSPINSSREDNLMTQTPMTNADRVVIPRPPSPVARSTPPNSRTRRQTTRRAAILALPPRPSPTGYVDRPLPSAPPSARRHSSPSTPAFRPDQPPITLKSTMPISRNTETPSRPSQTAIQHSLQSVPPGIRRHSSPSTPTFHSSPQMAPKTSEPIVSILETPSQPRSVSQALHTMFSSVGMETVSPNINTPHGPLAEFLKIKSPPTPSLRSVASTNISSSDTRNPSVPGLALRKRRDSTISNLRGGQQSIRYMTPDDIARRTLELKHELAQLEARQRSPSRSVSRARSRSNVSEPSDAFLPSSNAAPAIKRPSGDDRLQLEINAIKKDMEKLQNFSAAGKARWVVPQTPRGLPATPRLPPPDRL